jgi:hypothetical protein
MTWRQQRAVLAGVAALLGLAAVILAVTGLRVHSAGAALARAGCPQTGALFTSRCGRLQDALYHAGFPLSGNVPLVTIGLWAVPVLIGMFAGTGVRHVPVRLDAGGRAGPLGDRQAGAAGGGAHRGGRRLRRAGRLVAVADRH